MKIKPYLYNLSIFILVIYMGSFILLACIGGWLSFSPVPFWDMWDNLTFYNILHEEGYSAWWKQHNEHRIVLHRVLFWLDFILFEGSNIFLVIINYVLAAINFLVFLLIINKAFPNSEDKHIKIFLSFFSCFLIFSWMQMSNFVWAFQSQFFLAQLLPLTALYFLYLSEIKKDYSTLLFFFTCWFGVASIGTMANGVLALPILTIIALLLRESWQRVCILSLLSIISLSLYFKDFISSTPHSLIDIIFTQPLDLINYALNYLGGPFYYITGNFFTAKLAGIFFTLSSFFFAYKAIQAPKEHAIQIVLLGYIAYVGATAFATASGRINFGLESAISDRYMTPVLMAWSCICILYALLLSKKDFLLYIGASILLIISWRLFVFQMGVYNINPNIYFERHIAALAMELDVHDHQQLNTIFHTPERLSDIAKYARENNISIFGHPSIKDLKEMLKNTYQHSSTYACLGNLDTISIIPADPNFLKINGWLYDKNTNQVPEKIFILDKNSRVVGFALTGGRYNNSDYMENNHDGVGFKGYLLSSYRGQEVKFVGNAPDCYLDFTIPYHP